MFIFFAICLVFVFFANTSFAQDLGTITRTNRTTGTISAGAMNGTIIIDNPVNEDPISGIFTNVGVVDTNFPGSWYTPTVTNAQVGNFRLFAIGNAVATSTGSHRINFNFATPVTNPIIHFQNVDAGSFNFSPTTTVGGGAVSVTRLSGNNEFEVTGALANSTFGTALNNGCEDNAAANPNGGCGSVQLNGTYQNIRITATDLDLAAGGGDGYYMAFFLPADYGDAPASYLSAAHIGNGTHRLGATIDVENAT